MSGAAGLAHRDDDRALPPGPHPDDAAADLYEDAIAILDAAGWTHYEIANWARTPERLRATAEEIRGARPAH